MYRGRLIDSADGNRLEIWRSVIGFLPGINDKRVNQKSMLQNIALSADSDRVDATLRIYAQWRIII